MNREQRILKRKCILATIKALEQTIEELELEENKLVRGNESEYTLEEVSGLIKEKKLELRRKNYEIRHVE